MARLRLLLLTVLVMAIASPAHASPWQWPLGDHRIDRPFDPPASDYGAGHRGVDIPGRAGQTVRAVAAGRVTFAGRVAGIWTITVTHGDERSTYQPVSPAVRVGDAVTAGQPLGRLLGGHPSCRRTCLNLGRLRGERYLDPADLLATSGSYRLIDPEGTPPDPPDLVGGDLPLDGPVTSAYGMRVHPLTGVRKLHDGVDIGAPCGTSVPAAGAGQVGRAGANGAYGLQVEIRHAAGAVTSYSHLSSLAVRVGERIGAGTVVGRVGSTGASTGCHLHFMRLVDGRPVDPLGRPGAGQARG
ncbi:peptidoglycan DD-metalloendopeptidase family protein [Aeromicrobium senzhongii]|uniref:Peptidoglycan DD-metalloendopeptidase family protein n=1 Tax=Aeromicrobium senzhongii TaxID=2663859 RepID=A0ABX6SSX9_9ACTN|nr:peptidoglycan DD-metalloendopeptidase family protein [Aeromicrobium senzhongii]MTB86775.1 peptidoglycan DD-metalloendopeptidase family protein [Aeromicrobium senzhongii]QNL93380.1 peptidoglycan DD-metalloendopeptidase family protein [Aeromicrobium senzhongii]